MPQKNSMLSEGFHNRGPQNRTQYIILIPIRGTLKKGPLIFGNLHQSLFIRCTSSEGGQVLLNQGIVGTVRPLRLLPGLSIG